MIGLLLPGIVFFAVYKFFDIYAATASIMAMLPLMAVIGYAKKGTWDRQLLVTSGLVLIFGGLTLLLQDIRYIKIKVTIVNLFFSGALGVCLYKDISALEMISGKKLPLRKKGVERLQILWMCYFLAMAGLNEFIWRNYSTDFWVEFKTFVPLLGTIVIVILSVVLLRKHVDTTLLDNMHLKKYEHDKNVKDIDEQDIKNMSDIEDMLDQGAIEGEPDKDDPDKDDPNKDDPDKGDPDKGDPDKGDRDKS